MVNQDQDATLLRHLDRLTQDLDLPGTDLHAIIDVLIDDITEVVPSFLGLRMSVTLSANTITINAITPDDYRRAMASLLWPLHHLTPGAPASTLILYAAAPGAFTDLATETRRTFHRDGVVLDEHLPASIEPVTAQGVTGTLDATVINMAIGVLIDRGHLPEHAHHELTRRAAHHHDDDVVAAAKALLDSM